MKPGFYTACLRSPLSAHATGLGQSDGATHRASCAPEGPNPAIRTGRMCRPLMTFSARKRTGRTVS
jgi:hypothetical protein